MNRNNSPQLPAYRPPFWLRGGHLQSIWPKLVRIGSPAYRRELLPDSLGATEVAYDFVDGKRPDAPLLMLFHGLEGSSASHYARALMFAAQRHGWHGVVAHFRSCGEVENRAPVFYHSGDSAEVAHMLQLMHSRYPRICAVGISLGGNALAKYLAEQGSRAIPQAAAVVSAPLDLTAASHRLEQGLSKMLYAPYFLRSLLPKAAACAARFPQINADAADYYRRSSAKPLLHRIAVPTLILNALNDPFIPAESLPQASDVSPSVTLLQPEYGGHAGFPGTADLDWLPDTVLRYFDGVAAQAT